METKTKTTTEVVFDIVTTLYVIQANNDLLEIYEKKFGTEIKMAVTMAKGGQIKPEAKKYLQSIFEKIILQRKELLNQYIKLEKQKPERITGVKSTADKPKSKSKPKETKTPRRYGKVQIQKDVSEQGGKPTDMQRTMLKVNDLKRLAERLSRRAVAERYEDNKKLTDKEWREIEGAIDILESKANSIMAKPKKKGKKKGK